MSYGQYGLHPFLGPPIGLVVLVLIEEEIRHLHRSIHILNIPHNPSRVITHPEAVILLHLSLHLFLEGRSEGQLRAELYLKRSEIPQLIFVGGLVIGTHVCADDFFYFGQAAADVAVEEQKLIAVSLPDLADLLHHVNLDLREFCSQSGVLMAHLLPHSLHVPDLFVLLLHQQLMKLLVELTNAVYDIRKFLLRPAEVVMTAIDQPVNLCNLALNESHSSVFLVLQLAVGAVERDYLMLLVDVVLVHAGDAEWFFVADAVESSHVVVLQAPLEAFGVEDGGLQLDGTLDLLPKALDERCQSLYLVLLQRLQLHCVQFIEEVLGGGVEVFVGGAVGSAVAAEAGLASRSRVTHIITNSQVIIGKQDQRAWDRNLEARQQRQVILVWMMFGSRPRRQRLIGVRWRLGSSGSFSIAILVCQLTLIIQ